jgi:signal transduction histidine kinase
MYAHVPTALVALGFAAYIFSKKRDDTSLSLFLVSLCFAIWCFLNLNAWFPFMGAENMIFAWSLIDIFGLLFFFFAYRFLYTFVEGKDLPWWQWLVSLLLILPVFITTLFGLNILHYNINECGAYENELVVSYVFILQALFTLSALSTGVSALFNNKFGSRQRAEIVLATTGVILFLGFFVGISYFVNLLINYTSVENPYNYEIYGLFGMPVLLVFLGYLIVKYKSFDIKLIGAQALIVVLSVLVGSQIFFNTSTASFIVNFVTLSLVLIFGYFLVKGVKKEVQQREKIEELAKDLEKVNVRLKELDKQKSEFVSIASHQLRSPLTAIRGYASMLAEGSFGKLPEKALESAKRIEESAKLMAMSIEDYLNVSRIESGNMKYSLSDFNLRDMADNICDDLRAEAMKLGLVLLFRSNITSRGIVNADVGKTSQIIHNLINNSLKYTPKGSISVMVRDDVKKKKIYVEITDTGIGMSEKTQHTIFQKFERANNANSVNVSGTGLGLYVALKMAEAMGGDIHAQSEGDNKGSTFTFELPLAM